MDTAERLLRECRDMLEDSFPDSLQVKNLSQRINVHFSSIEAKESAAGQDEGSRKAPSEVADADSSGLNYGVESAAAAQDNLGAHPVPPALIVLEEPRDFAAYNRLGHLIENHAVSREDYDQLRSLLAQREEEITNLQAEAFDWRMRAEAAEHRAEREGWVMVPSREELIGAIARGWCHPVNEHKEMDTDLAEAINIEVRGLLSVAPKKQEGKP